MRLRRRSSWERSAGSWRRRFCALLALALLPAGYAVGRRFELKHSEPQARSSVAAARGADTLLVGGVSYRRRADVSSFLLLGIDQAAGTLGGAYRTGGQADFLLLLVADHSAKTLTPLAIDRDTLAEITVTNVLGRVSGTRRAQICLSYGFGDGGEKSCLLTLEAVERLLNAQIDGCVAMAVDGIAALNDALGGVPLTLTEDLSDLDPAMTRGATLMLSGVQAEYYVRGRIGVGEGTNESRMRRQTEYLRSLSAVLATRIRADKAFATALLDTLDPYLQSTLSRGRLLNEAARLPEYTLADPLLPDGTHRIDEDGFMEFLPDLQSLESLTLRLFYAPLTTG